MSADRAINQLEEPRLYRPRGKPARGWTRAEEERLKRLTERTDVRTAAQILERSEGAVRVRASLLGFSWRFTGGIHPLSHAAKLCGISTKTFLSAAKRAEVDIPPPNTSGIRPILDSQVALVKSRLLAERSGELPGPKRGNPKKPTLITKLCSGRYQGCLKSVTRPKAQMMGRSKVYCSVCWPIARIEQLKRAYRASKQSEVGHEIETKWKEWFRKRVIFAKASVFFERKQELGKSVTLFAVMEYLKFSRPYSKHQDKELILEAARKVGMITIKRGQTLLFLSP